jgi:hypothetical protein
MSSQGIPKINELPLSQDFIPGDKIIIDRDNKGYLIDYDNLFVGINQISFQQDIINDTNEVNNLQQYSTDKYNELIKELTEKNIGRSTAHLIDLTNVTSEGTLSSASYREFITSTDAPFIGPNNLVVFDSALVDKLSLSIDGVTTESAECDVDRVVFGQGTISIPKGTYRIRASISLSPEVNLDLNQNSLDEYIRRKQQVWSYLSFVQLTNPERTILNGSGASTYNNIGQSITLTLNGYFYTDKTKQYGLKVHTLGKLYPGVVTGTYSQNTNSGVVDTKYLSISDLFGREQFNQSRIIIERISETDTLSPLEDSPQGFRSQALALQPRVPLTYNAGWIQRINAQDTSVIPASSLFVITELPFNKVGNNYVGASRGYITEPKSYQGYIKIGDTVRYRKQQLNPQGILPTVFNKYDVRDSELKTPLPGWYGLIVDETIKKIGEKYDTIFRVDVNGVVSQRQYIADPEEYYRRCVSGSISPSVSSATSGGGTNTTGGGTNTTGGGTNTTGSSGTIVLPPLVVPRGGEIATANTGTKEVIVPVGVSFIHAVCVGGGEGGYRSWNPKKGDWYDGHSGQGGDLSYRNNIPVRAGDRLRLEPGAAGRGTTFQQRSDPDRKGGNSILYLNGQPVLRGAGGGRDPDNTPGAVNGRGGAGRQTKYISGGGKAGASPEEWPSGGGGAGGYGGSGGRGGREKEKGENGSGGGGGGGGASTGGSGGPGGGVGIFGKGANGVGSTFANNSPGQIGGAGSGGSGQSFGGGGRGISVKNDNINGMDGGGGAVRVIWGTGRSFPNTNTGP